MKPLLVKNEMEPSRAVTRAVDQIGYRVDLHLDDSKCAEEWSVEIADQYWSSSDAVLIMPDTEEGYNLGVLATPLASYLGIPVIVVHEMNQSVMQVLSKLNVQKSIVIGDELNGYGEVLRLRSVDDVVDASIDLVREKFGEIDYISITNPIDA